MSEQVIWFRLVQKNIDRANRIKADLAELRYAMPETIEGNKRASKLEEAGYLIEDILDTLGAY